MSFFLTYDVSHFQISNSSIVHFLFTLNTRICGFSNELSFKSIDDRVFAEVEGFVRNELKELLYDEQNAECFNAEKRYFFGLFASNIKNFRFMPGEKLQILELVKYVNQILNKDASIENQFEAPKKYKISTKDTIRSSVGLIFGRKYSKWSPVLNLNENDITSCTPDSKTKLVQQIDNLLLTFGLSITEDKISFTNDGRRITATVSCLVCEKDGQKRAYNVQYDAAKNSTKAYWNVSNYKKHLGRHSSVKIETGDDQSKSCNENEVLMKMENSDDQSNNLNENKVSTSMKSIVVELNVSDNETKTVSNHDNNVLSDNKEESSPRNFYTSSLFDRYKNEIYNQISEQNLRLTTSIMSNNELVQDMTLELSGQKTCVGVLKIRGDGNCMFAALAHQIFFHKINSPEHQKETANLREDAVAHIESNYEDYKKQVEARLNDNTQDGKFFISVILRSSGQWGGAESLLAISRIYQVNILIFNEAESCWYPFELNLNYKRTVAIAYRLKIQTIRRNRIKNQPIVRNHYDSISEVKQNILFTCTNILSANEVKRIDFKENFDKQVYVPQSK